ncbi:MAG: autotransporter domain-containing protein [Geminicoccaceae bacterium]|nr:autotransporter domain-containing protein [Geminicoccaceae bacterium]
MSSFRPCPSCRDRLLASAAMALALAVSASCKTATSADLCMTGSTTLSSAGGTGDFCDLGAGESVVIDSAGSLNDDTPATSAIRVTGAAGTIANAGSVTATDHGISLTTGTSLDSIANSGTITSGSDATDRGISINGAVVANQIRNDGTIDASVGVVLENGAQSGTITNTGTINAESAGIRIWQSNATINGSIVNEGEIRSTNTLHLAGNTITGPVINRGILTSPVGSVVRMGGGGKMDGGLINEAGALMESQGEDILHIVNSGSRIDFIDNRGTMRLTSTTPSNGAITLHSNGQITNGLVNSGTIDGMTNRGIFVGGTGQILGDVVNSGTIRGTTGIGIDNGTLARIENQITGVIAGIDYAISAVNPAVALTIDNAGTLDGDVQLADSTLNLTGSSSRVIGDVIGDVGSVVDVQGTFESEGAFNIDTLGVSTGGRLTLGHDVTATSGVTNAGTVDIAGGTVSITGDYTQAAGGSLALDVASATSYGTLAVSGVADIVASGAIALDVSGATNLANGATIADVITAGSINGTAISVSDNSAILDFTGIVDGATVDLTAQVNSLDTVLAGTSTAPGVDPAIASSLDTILGNSTLSGSSDIFGALMSLGTADDINRAMGQLDPSLGASAARFQVMNVHAGVNQVIADRLSHLSGRSGGTARAGFASLAGGDRGEKLAGLSALAAFEGDGAVFDEFIPLAAAGDIEGQVIGNNAWVKLFGARTLQESKDGAAGFDAKTGGFAIGVDYELDDRSTLGVSLAYSNSDVDGRNGSHSDVDIDSFQGSVYGLYDLGEATYVSGMIGGGTSDNSASRDVTVGPVDDKARADYDGWNVTAMLEVGHRVDLSPGLTVIPRAHAEYIYSDVDGYREKGIGGAGLDVEGIDADSLDLGLSTSLIYDPGNGVSLSGDFGFTYDVLADDNDVTSRFIAGGSTFTTRGVDPEKFTALAGLGVAFDISENMQAIAGYDLALRKDLTNHQLALKLRHRF